MHAGGHEVTAALALEDHAAEGALAVDLGDGIHDTCGWRMPGHVQHAAPAVSLPVLHSTLIATRNRVYYLVYLGNDNSHIARLNSCQLGAFGTHIMDEWMDEWMDGAYTLADVTLHGSATAGMGAFVM